MYLTHTLVQSLLFRTRSEGLPLDDRIRLTYQRAQAIGRAYCTCSYTTLHHDTIGLDLT